MSEGMKSPLTMENLVAEWIKSSGNFWETAMKKAQPASFPPSGPDGNTKSRFLDAVETTMKQWKSVSAVLNDPQTADTVLKGVNTMPEFFLTLAKTGWAAAARLQQQAVEKAGKIGQKTEAYNFEDLDQEMFKAWREIYGEEFQQYFNVPPLGLMRFYQERFNRFLDQSNLLQATLSEFMFLLYLPMEKSVKVFQDQVENMSREGNLPEKSKDYYNTWLKILEGHYMNLFKSSEYLQALRETVNQLEAFSKAKNQFLQDVLQSIPVPTNKDMDDVYKELHILKKRVRTLEKKAGDMPQPKRKLAG